MRWWPAAVDWNAVLHASPLGSCGRPKLKTRFCIWTRGVKNAVTNQCQLEQGCK
jgi:hypothetical protein